MTRFKTCFKCGSEKPITDFYKHSQMGDGHLNKCKECSKRDATNHRSDNIEKVREYDRQRAKRPSRIAAAIEITKAWRREDTRRARCHNAVSRAIRSGELIRTPCEQCGATKTVAHHDDYDKPLSVRWLCQACHSRHHRDIMRIES